MRASVSKASAERLPADLQVIRFALRAIVTGGGSSRGG
jgi:hypothetical protein